MLALFDYAYHRVLLGVYDRPLFLQNPRKRSRVRSNLGILRANLRDPFDQSIYLESVRSNTQLLVAHCAQGPHLAATTYPVM